jgi:TonB family protein
VILAAYLLVQPMSAPPPATLVQNPAKTIATPARVLSGYPMSNDYPRGALSRNSQGVSHIRLRIGADGTARDCQLFQSAGDVELDTAACRITTTRTRFAPALDVDGRPTVQYVILPIRWTIGN